VQARGEQFLDVDDPVDRSVRIGALAASRLLEPASLGTLRLPNRLVMAPMTRTRAGADGVPQPIMATYYGQRATAGLIIAEAAMSNAVGQTYPNITAIYNDAHVAGWRMVTDADVPPPGGSIVPSAGSWPERRRPRPSCRR
jgi:hypothetical protein